MAKNDKTNVSVELAKEQASMPNVVVGNYEKYPFFVKKNLEAKKLLAKVGLPKELTEKAN